MKTPSRRPTIGVTPDLEVSPQGVASYQVKASYPEAVLKAGGLPFLLPYTEDASELDEYIERVTGLLFTGGAFDIPPSAYGESERPGLGPTKPARTAFEKALLERALARNVPVLGVCGGMQLLNVALGGTLDQDIRSELPSASEHEQKHDRGQPAHPVEVRDGTFLASMLGRGQLMVNSTHHQAVNKLGAGLKVSAEAPGGIVEGIESSAHSFAVGVQWHPELLLGAMPIHLSIYRELVRKAGERRR